MAQPEGATQAPEKAYTPIHHIFKDTTSETSQGYDVYKVIIDSDEGRAYSMITTEPERLQFMRKHAHEKMPVVFATWHFYEDLAAGKEYSILLDSPEGREVDALMGDSDAERDEKTEGRLLAYFRAHAHKVQDLTSMTKRGG
jgi:hypothetical protein